MSDKVIRQDFRKVKEIKLPQSGLTVHVYNSILVGQVGEMPKGEDTFEFNVAVMLKVIKSWNMYASEADESPLPITRENLELLPAPDLDHLVSEMALFSAEQKKKYSELAGFVIHFGWTEKQLFEENSIDFLVEIGKEFARIERAKEKQHGNL